MKRANAARQAYRRHQAYLRRAARKMEADLDARHWPKWLARLTIGGALGALASVDMLTLGLLRPKPEDNDSPDGDV
jgi:hypothetical protein